MQIIFGRAGNIKGAVIQTYLLEKSRVITLDPGERSYHVFYQVRKCPWSSGGLERELPADARSSPAAVRCCPERLQAVRRAPLQARWGRQPAQLRLPGGDHHCTAASEGGRCSSTETPDASQATSNTYECTGIKDGDEFDRLKAALAAFDIKDEARAPPGSRSCRVI